MQVSLKHDVLDFFGYLVEKTFPMKSGMEWGCQFLSVFIHEVLMQQKMKERKKLQIWKK